MCVFREKLSAQQELKYEVVWVKRSILGCDFYRMVWTKRYAVPTCTRSDISKMFQRCLTFIMPYIDSKSYYDILQGYIMHNSTLFDQDRRPERCPNTRWIGLSSRSKATRKSYKSYVRQRCENHHRLIYRVRYVRYIHD